MRHTLVAMTVGLASLLCACGGGSGSTSQPPPPPPPSFDSTLLTGAYWRTSITVFASPFTGDVRWGTATGDGVSTYTVAGANNDGGVVIDPSTTFAVGYTVDADGTFHAFDGSEVARGGISADGTCVVTASVDGPPTLEIMIRKPSTPKTEASLAGDYNAVAFGTGGSSGLAITAQFSFDGISAYSGGGTSNTNGTVSGGPLTGSYAIASDGAMGFESFGSAFVGGVSETTGVATVGGGANSLEDPIGWLLVRRGAGKSNASFSGEYWLVGIEYEFGGPTSVCFQGSAVADGAGNLTFTGTRFEEFTTPTTFSAGATYLVTPSGDVQLNRTGVTPAENLTGGISPNDKWVAVSGGTDTTNNPIMMVMIRKQ